MVMVAGADWPRLRMISSPETFTRPGPPIVAPMTSTRPRMVEGVNAPPYRKSLPPLSTLSSPSAATSRATSWASCPAPITGVPPAGMQT